MNATSKIMYDVIVCGAGVQGLSTANYLAEEKQKVLVIEQFLLPHARGSSHGATRCTRYSYPEEHYACMMPECFAKWKDLEEKTDINLFVACGLLTIGDTKYITSIADNLEFSGQKYELLNQNAILNRFPGVDSKEFEGVYEERAGILKADKCLQALQKSLITNGGEIRDGEKVEKVEQLADESVEVSTSKGKYSARKVVLACGAWINKVLKPLHVQLPIQPIKVKVFYFKVTKPSMYDIANFPVVYIQYKAGVYSLPVMEYNDLMKVCFHHGVKCDPDEPAKTTRGSEAISAVQRRMLRECMEKHYTHLAVEEPCIEETCIYSMTPDKDCILEPLTNFPSIIVGAGFSGMGFKLGPVIGRILGDMALDRKPAYPLHPFSSQRFNKKPNL